VHVTADGADRHPHVDVQSVDAGEPFGFHAHHDIILAGDLQMSTDHVGCFGELGLPQAVAHHSDPLGLRHAILRRQQRAAELRLDPRRSK
jgi:hypothetical protein